MLSYRFHMLSYRFHMLSYRFHMLSYRFHMLSYRFDMLSYRFDMLSYRFGTLSYHFGAKFVRFYGISGFFYHTIYPYNFGKTYFTLVFITYPPTLYFYLYINSKPVYVYLWYVFKPQQPKSNN
jgi:hypothetical protein